jgi:hypothetical protein
MNWIYKSTNYCEVDGWRIVDGHLWRGESYYGAAGVGMLQALAESGNAKALTIGTDRTPGWVDANKRVICRAEKGGDVRYDRAGSGGPLLRVVAGKLEWAGGSRVSTAEIICALLSDLPDDVAGSVAAPIRADWVRELGRLRTEVASAKAERAKHVTELDTLATDVRAARMELAAVREEIARAKADAPPPPPALDQRLTDAADLVERVGGSRGLAGQVRALARTVEAARRSLQEAP